MAKTLVEFENEMLDVMGIFRISKREIWNEDKEDFDYCIIFNPGFPDKFLLKDLLFKFDTFEIRERKMVELKNKVGELEHIMIL